MQHRTHFLASELLENNSKKSRFHIIPVPLEMSVSYGGGTAGGPGAILAASQQLEAWDGQSLPLDMGIYTADEVDCTGAIETILERIETAVGKALSFNAVPVVLGGEHTVTLGALRALESHLGKPFGIVQIDAHADLRDHYQDSRFSHACVMRRALDEMNLPLFQLGVRALCLEEHEVRTGQGVGFLDARALYLEGIPDTPLPDDFPDHIYLSVDVDGLDPSVIRATGTPVPGGINWHDALTLIEKCIYKRKLAGFDVVELAPVPGDHGSDFAAAQLVYTIMGMVQRSG